MGNSTPDYSGVANRHKKKRYHLDNKLIIDKPAIRRMARRGGVKRICKDIYEDTGGVAKMFVENILKNALTIAEGNHKIITVGDVLYALRREGRPLYL